LARYGATDYADIVAYNPAGTTKMDDGAYLKLDVMYIAKDYSNTVPGAGKLEQDEPSLVPGLFALYKQDKWSGFFALTIPGGGGKVEFNEGSATTVGASLALTAPPLPGGPFILPSQAEGESVYYGYTFGGAFAINDMWSISLGLRYIDAFKNGKLSIDTSSLAAFGYPTTTLVDYEKDADGWGGIIGLNITPTELLNIGLIYQTNTKLDFETDIKQDTVGNVPGVPSAGALDPSLVDGAKQREDLPGLIGVGVSYQLIPQLRMETDFTYYLEKDATWETRLDGEGNSWEWSLMGEYTFNPQWKASLGYMHSEIDVDPVKILPEAPELTANTIGAGAVWSPAEAWAITFGATKVWYDSVTSSQTSPFTFAPAGTKYEKDVWSIFVGAQWKFM
jgi:long-chain fatty acid transport protein